MNKRAFLGGLIIGALLMRVFFVVTNNEPEHEHSEHTHSEDVHEHGDFSVVIDGRTLDFTGDQYQSSAEQIRHANTHLHDNQGNIVHRHAENVTFNDLLTSIGFTYTGDCLTLDTGEIYCSDDEKTLALFVNNALQDDPLAYIVQDNDRILLYYGDLDDTKLTEYLDAVSDEACIYSGTCPERGLPPAEGCGLTCEVPIEDTY